MQESYWKLRKNMYSNKTPLFDKINLSLKVPEYMKKLLERKLISQ